MKTNLRVLLPLMVLAGCSTSTTVRKGLPPVRTVAAVDLNRYLGTWYEIASFPQGFQKGCHATTATYALQADGKTIDVTNRCRKDSLDGPESVANGRARVVDPATNAKLEVSFFGPFWGDYWIVELDPEYRFAAVGNPGRDYLWILSRTPTMDEATWADLTGRLAAQGFELDRLQRTEQRPAQ